MDPLTIALIGAGGYYLYKKFTKSDKETATPPIYTPKPKKHYAKPNKFLSQKLESIIKSNTNDAIFYLKKIRESSSYLPINQQQFIKKKFEFIKKVDLSFDFNNQENKKNFLICKDFLENFENEIKESHLKFTKNQIKKYPNIFSRSNKDHTISQSRSIISEEKNTLVVAGAGSGKTSTIIGRIYYLVIVKKIPPQNILVITYTKNAAKELKKRLNQINNIEIKTIHAFGKKVLLQSSLSGLDRFNGDPNTILQDDEKFSIFVQESLNRYSEKDNGEKLEKYFLSHLLPYKSILDQEIKSLSDYISYSKQAGSFRTLKNEYLKSFEELEIANFLTLNGINYEYEKKYKFNTVGQDENGMWRRQYKPDFYLPDYDLYIEHYALDRGNKAPRWFEPGYYESTLWKRQLHKKNNTKCIETFSYERMENKLLDNLHLKLSAEGVVFKTRDTKELLEIFNQPKNIRIFDRLIQSFITHFKSNELTISSLRTNSITKGFFDIVRLNAFIDIFEHIYTEYQDIILKDSYDFIDMLIESKKVLKKQTSLLNYQHIIVDEFQDISTSTLNLITEILKKTKSSHLFVVGDDWQSIYQFLGGNLKYFIDFENYFGHTDHIQLEETFRFHQPLADAATKFITKNKNQLNKNISSTLKPEPEIKIPIQILLSTKTFQNIYMKDNKLTNALKELEEQNLIDIEITKLFKINENATIFVIGRYNNQALALHLERTYPDKNIKYHTVHSSKGLEADYVIINNVISGFKGFPSEMEDDPILKLVTNSIPNEGINNPEERRLFYVALTRAKYRVHIIGDNINESSFVKEIKKYNEVSTVLDTDLELIDCLKCHSGKMILFENSIDQSLFFSCQNKPICDNKFEYSELLHEKYLSSKIIKKLEL